MSKKILTTVTNQHGVKFNVHIVCTGSRYGLNDCLVNRLPEPLIEFYDTRYPHTELGQFVSRYNLGTFMEGSGPIFLWTHEPNWYITAENRKEIVNAYNNQGQ